ncbi:MAG: DUF4914 family protein, partial [Anaerolineaceae bacterium]
MFDKMPGFVDNRSNFKRVTPKEGEMDFTDIVLPVEARRLLETAPSVMIAESINQLIDLSCGGPGSNSFEVAYQVPGFGRVVEANVVRVRNGVSANFTDP